MNNIWKILPAFSAALVPLIAGAVTPADVPLSKLTAEEVGTDLVVHAVPPAGHHFNLEAPTRLAESESGKTFKPKVAEATQIEFSVPREDSKKRERTFEAKLFVCDDAQTYCLPQKVHLTWNRLTARLEAMENRAMRGRPMIPSMKRKHDEFGFILNDPTLAFERARKEKKPLLIDFYAIWCPPCNRLNEETFPSAEFQEMAKKFVLLKIDADTDGAWELKSRYKVGGYPTLLFTTSKGEEISRFTDFRSPSEFVREMQVAYENRDTGLGKLRKKANKGDREAQRRLGVILLNSDSASAVAYLEKALKDTPVGAQEREALWEARIDAHQKKPEDLQGAILEFPDSPRTVDYRIALASWHAKKGNRETQQKELRTAVELADRLLVDPSKLEARGSSEKWILMSQAEAFEELGDKEASRRAYEKAADVIRNEIAKLGRKNPARGEHMDLIDCLWRAGRRDEAGIIFASFQQRYPSEFTFFFYEAKLLMKAGEAAKAEPKAESAVEYSYGDNRLRSVELLARVRTKLGKKEQALELVRTTLRELPPPSKDLKVRTADHRGKLETLERELR